MGFLGVSHDRWVVRMVSAILFALVISSYIEIYPEIMYKGGMEGEKET